MTIVGATQSKPFSVPDLPPPNNLLWRFRMPLGTLGLLMQVLWYVAVWQLIVGHWVTGIVSAIGAVSGLLVLLLVMRNSPRGRYRD